MNLDEAMDLADHASPLPHLAGEALCEALRVLRAELERLRAACHDCGCLYESFGLDLTLPHDEWALVSAGTNGLLCANCICRRAAELPGAIAVRASIEGLTAPEPPEAQVVAVCPDCKAIVERVARAICVRVGTYDPDESVEVGGGRSIPGWCVYQPEASAALKAVFAHA